MSESLPIRQKARLIERNKLSDRHFLLRFAASEDFSWRPGQYLPVFSQEEGGAVNYFSIASAPGKLKPGEFELLVSEDSCFSFSDVSMGDPIWLEAPLGEFPLERLERASNVVLIGMGTGIAPLRAVAQSLASRAAESPTVVILHGVRQFADAAFFEELSSYGDRIRFYPILTSPSPEWQGRVGRVQQHLNDLPIADTEFCLCGSHDMVLEVRALLVERGVEDSRIASQGA